MDSGKCGSMGIPRRGFLASCAAAGAVSLMGRATGEAGDSGPARRYHLSISPDALDADPDLLSIVRRAGVTDLWLTGFLYGYWYYPLEKTVDWRRRVEAAGMAAHIINVPLGHPGDSLGAKSGNMPLTPPNHWKLGVRPDDSTYAGTSLHDPATAENAEAMKKVQAAGFKRVFVDDDFRLARGPGVIGGCFCDEHKKRFLESRGYKDPQWAELLDAVKNRNLTDVLRTWLEFTCDELTASFRAQQAAAPETRLGIMIMYMGAEKAGIRLADYRSTPFRVGELMFDDDSFTPVKGKTNELFSALFHRRYARPELAYSESTAYPADRLSAKNMAAKLAVSTLSDVRNTMFMSGVTAFPRTHWDTLGPAMKRHIRIHERVAGHTPRGPFKHFWGEHGRKVSGDNTYSLFLAAGVPFEVCDEPPGDGWTFLGEADAHGLANILKPGHTRWVAPVESGTAQVVPESLPALFALKKEILPQLKNTPFIEEDKPAVCAWYPTARIALIWNLSEQKETLTLRTANETRPIEIDGLDVALIDDVRVS